MSISVVIPLYNKAPHIERALQSVLSQTSLPDEIIVVDDGSTDGGGEMVKKLTDPRIRLITQKNQGESAARNRGITEARGELIAFLDADDAWKPRFLEVILELRQKYPEAGAYGTAFEIIKPDGSKDLLEFVWPSLKNDSTLINNYVKAALIRPNFICSSAVAIPIKTFKQVGDFPVSEICSGDMDMWLRIGLSYPIAYSRRKLAIYYMDATNRIYGFKRFQNEPAISQTSRKAIQSGELSPEMIKDLKEYVARYQLKAARDFLTLGKRSLAIKMLNYSKGHTRNPNLWWKWRFLALLPGKSAHYLWKLKRWGHRHQAQPISDG
jgi:glycosyltransferase involved in cell wall biosynthesis